MVLDKELDSIVASSRKRSFDEVETSPFDDSERTRKRVSTGSTQENEEGQSIEVSSNDILVTTKRSGSHIEKESRSNEDQRSSESLDSANRKVEKGLERKKEQSISKEDGEDSINVSNILPQQYKLARQIFEKSTNEVESGLSPQDDNTDGNKDKELSSPHKMENDKKGQELFPDKSENNNSNDKELSKDKEQPTDKEQSTDKLESVDSESKELITDKPKESVGNKSKELSRDKSEGADNKNKELSTDKVESRDNKKDNENISSNQIGKAVSPDSENQVSTLSDSKSMKSEKPIDSEVKLSIEEQEEQQSGHEKGKHDKASISKSLKDETNLPSEDSSNGSSTLALSEEPSSFAKSSFGSFGSYKFGSFTGKNSSSSFGSFKSKESDNTTSSVFGSFQPSTINKSDNPWIESEPKATNITAVSMFAEKQKKDENEDVSEDEIDQADTDVKSNDYDETAKDDLYVQVDTPLEAREVKTGEEAEESFFSCRAKLYALDLSASNQAAWKERGVGQVHVNGGKKEDGSLYSRIIMRSDAVLRVILNQAITKNTEVQKGMKSSLASEKFVRITGFEDGTPFQYALRAPTKDIATELSEHLERLGNRDEGTSC